MDTDWKPRTDISIADIADKIRFARRSGDTLGKVIFLIGAGCSVTAGIPGAPAIARLMVKETAARFDPTMNTADHVQAYQALVSRGRLEACAKGGPAAEVNDEAIDW